MPAPARIEAALRRQETADRAILASRMIPLSLKGVEGLRSAAKAADREASALAAEIDAITDRLAALIIERRRRAASIWHRWRDAAELDTTIAALEERRDSLRGAYGRHRLRHVRAKRDGERARRDQVVAEVEAEREHASASRDAAKRIATVERARRLVSRIPALADLGVRRLLLIAMRIERALTGVEPMDRISTP